MLGTYQYTRRQKATSVCLHVRLYFHSCCIGIALYMAPVALFVKGMHDHIAVSLEEDTGTRLLEVLVEGFGETRVQDFGKVLVEGSGETRGTIPLCPVRTVNRQLL